MRLASPPLLALLWLGLSFFTANAQSSSFEKVVAAPLFSSDGMAKAGQVQPDQGACVFVSNANIGQLGDANMLLLRVNAQGTIVQNLTIGDDQGQGYHDVAKEVVQANKSYYITGYTRAIDTSAAHTFTALLIKVDTALNFQWQKNYVLPGEEMYAEAMTTVGMGDLLIAGKIYDGSDFNSFVMRTDSAGLPLWIKQYQIPFGETIECVRVLPGGDILLSGAAVFGFELVLPFVCKLDSAGAFHWGNFYNYPPGFVETSNFQFIHTSSVDHIQLAGHTDKFGAGASDLFVVDIDSSGAVNWAKTYGGTQFDWPYMVQYDTELVLVGNSGSFATLGIPYPMAARIAANGTLISAALYGDTSVYQPARFYHSCRVGTNARLLMGARDTPADDLYLVGTNADLENGCAYHPVAMVTAPQTSGTSAFTAIMTTPVPQVNALELARATYPDGTFLCDMPMAISHHIVANELAIIPSFGDGGFRIGSSSFIPARVRVLDMEGRSVAEFGAVSGELHLPSSLQAGAYWIEATDANGSRRIARYVLQ